MTDKEELFAVEYLVDCNAMQAAIRAGYKKSTAKYAYEWLVETLPNSTAKRHLPFKPELKAFIEEKLNEIKSVRLADAKEVLEYLTSVMRGEVMEETLRFVGDGVQEIDEIDASTKERTKAAELLGKYYSLWTDKVKLDGNQQVIIVDDIPRGGCDA